MGMNIRTVGYFVLDGLKGLWRNRLMSIAAISAVIAALVIFGIFMIFSRNIAYMGEQVQGQQEIRVFVDKNLNPKQMEEIGNGIRGIQNVKEVILETKEQQLQNLKTQLGEKANILDGLEKDNPLRDSYRIKLLDMKQSLKVEEKLRDIKGIVNIKNDRDTFAKLVGVTSFIKHISFWGMFLLALIAVFIISNTIKLAIFARRKEINIMKFVGATDWFIRWPFMVEGMVIGIIGAGVAFLFVGYGYGYASQLFLKDLGIFKLLELPVVLNLLGVQFMLLGAGIGAIGSAVCLRKHLKV